MGHGRIAPVGMAVMGLSALALGAPAVATAQPPGEAIFHGKGLCFSCHGKAGAGTAVGPALNDATWIAFDTRPTVAQVEALVRRGVPEPVEHPAPMPPRGGGGLSDEEVAAVARYVVSLTADGGGG